MKGFTYRPDGLRVVSALLIVQQLAAGSPGAILLGIDATTTQIAKQNIRKQQDAGQEVRLYAGIKCVRV